MRIAPLFFVVSALAFASPAAAQSQSDAVNPWQTAETEQAAPPPPAPMGGRDAWQGEVAPPPVDGTRTKVIGPKRGLRRPAAKKAAATGYVPAARRGKEAVRNPEDPVAWFPGFIRLENGTTRVFLEVSKRVEITEHRAEGRITYRLKGAAVPERVNRMPLVTAWIPTAVDRVTLSPAGPDADLVIDLRRPSESSYRVLETPRGVVLQVDFPAVVGFEGAPPPAPPAVRPTGRGKASTQIDDHGGY